MRVRLSFPPIRGGLVSRFWCFRSRSGWSWLMNSSRLRIDYERDPAVTEGFIWAAHTRYLLRRLTEPPKP